MRQHPDNPSANNLSNGFPENKIISAIADSGYPLQGRIAKTLQGRFHVTEEWGYFDTLTNLHQSLDIFAFRQHQTIYSERVHPSCALLVECKHSGYPYIFFRRIADHKIHQFPHVLGVHERVALHQRIRSNQKRIIEVYVGDALGLDELPFVNPGPHRSAGFSKVVRKGKDFELSGTEPFNNTILPLSRALDHMREQHKPTGHQTWAGPILAVCMCLLEAPMILVEEPEKLDDPLLIPWVRVVRQEARRRAKVYERPYRFYVVDFIHVKHFDAVIQNSVSPFFDAFAERVVQKTSTLLSGSGTVRDLANWGWQEVA